MCPRDRIGFSWTVRQLWNFYTSHLVSLWSASHLVLTLSYLWSRWGYLFVWCCAWNWRSSSHCWSHFNWFSYHFIAGFSNLTLILSPLTKKKFIYLFQIRPSVRICVHHFSNHLLKAFIWLERVWRFEDFIKFLKNISKAENISVESVFFIH